MDVAIARLDMSDKPITEIRGWSARQIAGRSTLMRGTLIGNAVAMAALLLARCSPSSDASPHAAGASASGSAGPSGMVSSTAASTGRLAGVVTFAGEPPPNKVPAGRRDFDVCKRSANPRDVVVVTEGKLKDVLVRIENGGVRG